MGVPRVLCGGLCSDVSCEPHGQEGRLQTVRGPRRSNSRRWRGQSVLAADLRRIPEPAVPAAERFCRAEGHPGVRNPQREDHDCAQDVLSDRPARGDPQEVGPREPRDDGRVQRYPPARYRGHCRSALGRSWLSGDVWRRWGTGPTSSSHSGHGEGTHGPVTAGWAPRDVG